MRAAAAAVGRRFEDFCFADFCFADLDLEDFLFGDCFGNDLGVMAAVLDAAAAAAVGRRFEDFPFADLDLDLEDFLSDARFGDDSEATDFFFFWSSPIVTRLFFAAGGVGFDDISVKDRLKRKVFESCHISLVYEDFEHQDDRGFYMTRMTLDICRSLGRACFCVLA